MLNSRTKIIGALANALKRRTLYSSTIESFEHPSTDTTHKEPERLTAKEKMTLAVKPFMGKFNDQSARDKDIDLLTKQYEENLKAADKTSGPSCTRRK